jgi:hypothetical protein
LTIAKGLSQEAHLGSEITFVDGKAWPNTSEQFVLRDELARALNQNDQEVERTSANVDGCISLKQDMRRWPQTKRSKPNRAVNRRGNFTFSVQRQQPR